MGTGGSSSRNIVARDKRGSVEDIDMYFWDEFPKSIEDDYRKNRHDLATVKEWVGHGLALRNVLPQKPEDKRSGYDAKQINEVVNQAKYDLFMSNELLERMGKSLKSHIYNEPECFQNLRGPKLLSGREFVQSYEAQSSYPVLPELTRPAQSTNMPLESLFKLRPSSNTVDMWCEAVDTHESRRASVADIHALFDPISGLEAGASGAIRNEVSEGRKKVRVVMREELMIGAFRDQTSPFIKSELATERWRSMEQDSDVFHGLYGDHIVQEVGLGGFVELEFSSAARPSMSVARGSARGGMRDFFSFRFGVSASYEQVDGPQGLLCSIKASPPVALPRGHLKTMKDIDRFRLKFRRALERTAEIDVLTCVRVKLAEFSQVPGLRDLEEEFQKAIFKKVQEEVAVVKDGLREECDGLTMENANLKSKIADISQELVNLSTQLQRTQRENVELKASKANMTQDGLNALTEKTRQLDELKEKLLQSKQEAERSKKEREDLNGMLIAERAEVKEMRKAVEDMRKATEDRDKQWVSALVEEAAKSVAGHKALHQDLPQVFEAAKSLLAQDPTSTLTPSKDVDNEYTLKVGTNTHKFHVQRFASGLMVRVGGGHKNIEDYFQGFLRKCAVVGIRGEDGVFRSQRGDSTLQAATLKLLGVRR